MENLRTHFLPNLFKVLIFGLIFIVLETDKCLAQCGWAPKNDFGGTAEKDATTFGIGNKGYIVNSSELWEYDPVSDLWSQKTSGPNGIGGIGFSIDTVGYVVSGNSLWEYNPNTDSWTPRANFPGVGRTQAVGFSIGLKGYIGVGSDGGSTNYKDFWEWDQATDTWNQKADIGGSGGPRAIGFSIGTKGYISGCGGTMGKNMWEWNQATNTWSEKAIFPGIPRQEAVGFSIGTKGYVGTGDACNYGNGCVDFWEWDQISDTWSQKNNFIGPGRKNAISMVIGSKGYVGIGGSNSGVFADFFEYNPATALSVNLVINNSTCYTNNDASATATISGGTSPFNYSWSTSPAQTSASATGLSEGNYNLNVSDNVGCTSYSYFSVSSNFGAWKKKENFSGIGRYGASGFSIGSKGYLGTGFNGGYKKDFWEWDQTTNIWTQMADFGGTARQGAVGFSIGTKGYFGTGEDGALKRDFWEFDPVANTWSPKSNFGGSARSGAVGFSIGNKGYIGTGSDGANKSDFWEYNQETNSWLQKANFGYTVYAAAGFSIGSKGYIGTGTTGWQQYSDQFWEYDTTANSWTQKATFPGTSREEAIAFSIDSLGYLGLGYTGYGNGIYFNDLWQYNPFDNSWKNKANFSGVPRTQCVSFAIATKGYIGTGLNDATFNDLWEYDPSLEIVLSITSSDVSCYSGSDGISSVIPLGGITPYSYLWNNSQTDSTATSLTAGVYDVTVTDVNSCRKNISANIFQPTEILLSTGQTNVSCKNGNDGNILSSATGGTGSISFMWSTGDTTAGTDSLVAGDYSITVTDSNSCSKSTLVTITEPPLLSFTFTQNNVSCNGGNDGNIPVTASGGTGSIQYSSDSGSTYQSANTLNGLSLGTYEIVIKDANNCITPSQSAIITEPPPIVFSTSNTNVTCYGGNNAVITVNGSGGTGTLQFSKNNGSSFQSSNVFTNVSAGTYNIVVKDGNNCITSSQSVLVSQPAAINLSVTQTNVSCNGGSNGSLVTSAGGGTGSLFYNWSTGGTGNSISGLSASPYSVTVTDDSSCTLINSFNITHPDILAVSFSVTNVKCFGANNGAVNMSVSGGTPNFSYSWSNGQNSEDITNLFAGIHRVTVTDTKGCVKIDSVTVGQPQVLTASISKNNVSCNGLCDGSATALPTGGTSPFTYLWNDSLNQTSSMATGLCPGSYNVNIADANNCQVTPSASITEPSSFSLAFGSNPATCGNADGSATITVTGGISPYAYLWSNSQTATTISGILADNYSVTITDNNGCVDSGTVTVSQPTTFSSTVTSTNVSCNGGSDGSAVVTPAGGNSPYSYLWSDSSISGGISGLSVGDYEVTITDVNGCFSYKSTTLSEPSAVSSVFIITDVQCFGNANGSVVSTVSGGNSPYSYNWSNLSTTKNLSNLSAGTYFVTITDNNNCLHFDSAVVSGPAQITSNFSIDSVTCYGFCNATASINVNGGTSPYLYLWSDPQNQTTISASGLCQGNYNVNITDVNGCSSNNSVAISQPSILTANISTTNVLCYGGANGTANITVSGGTSPYNFNWSNGQTGPSVIGLFPGQYAVNSFDSKGCLLSNNISITQPQQLSSQASVSYVSCFAGSNGAINLTVSGGTSPYSFNWSDGSLTEDISGLTAGTYTVTIIDSCNASFVQSIQITQPGALSSAITKTNVSCNGGTNGNVSVSVSGGVSPYFYSWSTGETSNYISGLQQGIYYVTISDNCSQIKIDSAEVNQPQILTTSVSKTNVSCYLAGNGTATVLPSGGTTPYTYLWSNNQSNASAVGLFMGTYSVNVVDANGCLASTVVSITQPDEFNAAVYTVDVTCNSGNDGMAGISISGGTSPYYFNWSDGTTNSTSTGLSQGIYSVTVSDSCGASIIKSVAINEPGILTTNISSSNVKCEGGTNGTAALSVSGGVSPYSFLWSTGNVSSSISNLSQGNYYVTVTDNCGKIKIDSVMVDQPSILTSSVTKTDVSCYLAGNGTATVSASGGTSPYIYLWSNNQSNATAVGLFPGNYSVNVVDANGCLASGLITITQPAPLSATASVSYVSCNSGSDGSVDLTINGGTSPYSFNWSNGAITEDISGLSAGSYFVSINDSCGGTVNLSVDISQSGSLSVSLSESNVSCNGGINGSVVSAISGGVTPYGYNWSTGSNQQSISNLSAGTYSLTVIDACNQMVVDSALITQPSAMNTSISKMDVTCNGAGDGNSTVSVSGGISPYTFLWSNNQTNSTAVGLFPGFYSVNVVDANGCLASNNISITQPSAISAAFFSSDVSCNSDSNGSINLMVSGGTSPYTFLWSNNATTGNISGISAGIYSVTVNDSCGAMVTKTINISQPGILSASVVKNDVSCNNGTNGYASINPSGGVTPYSFLWSNGGTQNFIDNLPEGNYSVTVTDSCGKMLVDSVIISQPLLLTSSVSKTDVTCNGLGNGTVTVIADGGTTPYSYQWNNGQTTSTAIGLFVGFYSVNVFDANNCLASNSISIYQPAALSLNFSKTDATCGSSDGELTANVNGGSSPYTYLWSNGDTLSFAINLSSQVYSVTVTDSNSCSISDGIGLGVLSLPQPICIVTVDSTSTKNLIVWEKEIVSNVDSFKIYRDFSGTLIYIGSVAYEDLSVFADATQGVNPNIQSYYYRISVLDTCGNESSLSAIHKTIHLANPILVSQQIELSWDGYQGFGSNFYYRILRKSTGGGTFQVIDSVPSTNFQYTDINPPTGYKDYLIEVVHPNGGCSATKSAENHNSSRSNKTTAAPPGSTLSASTITFPASAGNCDGMAVVTASGGLSPYTFQWDGNTGGQTNDTASGLCPGTYSVTVTDSTGLTTFVFATVNVLPGIKSITNIGNEVMVYPNPNDGSFMISSFGFQISGIRIFNILGETVYSSFLTRNSPFNIYLTGISSGIYNLQLISENGIITKKIIVE